MTSEFYKIKKNKKAKSMKNLEQIRSILNIEPYDDNGILCCTVSVEGFNDKGRTFRLDGRKIDEVLKNDNIVLWLHEHFSVVLSDEYVKKTGDTLPIKMVTFTDEKTGKLIENPFLSADGHFVVDPIDEYGFRATMSHFFVSALRKDIDKNGNYILIYNANEDKIPVYKKGNVLVIELLDNKNNRIECCILNDIQYEPIQDGKGYYKPMQDITSRAKGCGRSDEVLVLDLSNLKSC